MKRRTRPRLDRPPDRVRCDAHLQYLRGFICAASDQGCGGKIEAAHVRMCGDGGMALKPGDDRVVPLCARHHQIQHQIGERRFWHEQRIDPLKLAAELWAASPAGKRYRMEHDD